jgi:hypothetical protein
VSTTQPVSHSVSTMRARARSLRRARAMTSLMMLISLVAIGFGVFSTIATGSWILLACAAASFTGSFAVLGRLARASRRRALLPAVAAAPVASELYDHSFDDVEPEAEAPATWTPHPLPKPLHLSRGTIAASAMASIDAAAELRRAAARAELERRAAELVPDATPLRRIAPVELPEPAEQPVRAYATSMASVASASAASAPTHVASSRFASMGVIDADAPGAIDLDAALRRRRAAS